ncbi:uncharacterized protein LOC117120194 [Anneissia japonica]|uniref:uncharacterized protein LOC117120194 n=1 Tax=Anneissia japonica TaxID=1529436 RepID=UPI0014258DCD|nr:uncharacterized protein LOC117120194 [Anneissia japonica]
MEETGISESVFNQLLDDFSRWYNRLGYINMLKVLYNNRDHVPVYNQLIEATDVRFLLSMLIVSGNLSQTNLTILYDTIKVTGLFGFKSRIVLPPLQRIREREVSKFSWYRQFLLKLGMHMTRCDINMLDVRYNMPFLMNYNDSWQLILDLEQRKELCEEKIDYFIEGLPSYMAMKDLLEGMKFEKGFSFKMVSLIVADVIPVVTQLGTCDIELCFGDITKLPVEEKVDIVVVSAFRGDYSPTPTSLIGSLKLSLGLDVRRLAQNKEEDLREIHHCWWTSVLPKHLPFKRLMCFEAEHEGFSRPQEHVGDVFRCLNLILNNQDGSVITPLLNTGDQVRRNRVVGKYFHLT